jgi:hypothetical protein
MIYLTAENNNPKPALPYLKAVEDTVEAIVEACTVEAAIVAGTVAARIDPVTAIVTVTVTGKFLLVPSWNDVWFRFVPSVGLNSHDFLCHGRDRDRDRDSSRSSNDRDYDRDRDRGRDRDSGYSHAPAPKPFASLAGENVDDNSRIYVENLGKDGPQCTRPGIFDIWLLLY